MMAARVLFRKSSCKHQQDIECKNLTSVRVDLLCDTEAAHTHSRRLAEMPADSL